MIPALAARRFACSVLLGGVLGLVYGFLRPPGRRHRHLADLLFLAAALWCWLYVSFAVCRGDIRAVYLAGMAGGLVFWEAAFGKWLRPFFDGLWQGMARLLGIVLFPWKKILHFAKILFASVKKWVTIVCTKVFKSQKKRREESHGTKKHPAQKSETGSSSRIQYP